MKKKARFVRRIIHGMAGVSLVYYLLPLELFGFHRRVLLGAVVISILVFELVRSSFGWDIPLLRDYERRDMAAYAWFCFAVGLCMLIFPMHISAVCIMGMGIVDPVIGEMHTHWKRFYPAIPLVIWILISVFFYWWLTGRGIVTVIPLSVVGAVVAVAVEKPDIYIDDDFLMVFVPALALFVLELIL